MSRRDTIIIAVLLNAGLLIVLFATSLKSEKSEESSPTVQVLATQHPQVKETQTLPVVPQTAQADQIDQVIKQYVTPQVTSMETQPNFLADLQAIGTGQAPAADMAPPAAVEESGQVAFKEVKVKKGDVLERIAKQNHVSVDDIMKANHLSTSRLKIGQTLKIPSKSGKRTVAPVQTSEESQFYTIKAGDSPWTIAVKHHMKVEELLKLNNMDEAKARRLKPGDKIRIQ
ncbi:MAG TPA: LysM peptidoglycan-binding domain-containing protein [Rhabdochlamydiaceae bacterium]|nr:LysM peptidoglycan-binding domain-containing protein [Rhabdochlamydiaceae bacterium]